MEQININQKITEIRKLTKEELEEQGWEDCAEAHIASAAVLVLEDGTKIFPSQDDEGNGPGTLFGILPNGENVYIIPG
jgi:hypothetical protein